MHPRSGSVPRRALAALLLALVVMFGLAISALGNDINAVPSPSAP